MEYVDKETGEVTTKLSIGQQLKRAENMVEVYREHLLNLYHQNMLTKEESSAAYLEAQAVFGTVQWIADHAETIREVVAQNRAEG